MLHPPSPYAGRQVALATRHGKERVMARPLRLGLGASLLHLPSIDTDRLGTFCGSVERPGTALEACTLKAQLALQHGGSGLAIASEGSFGPHPAVPLLAVGRECLVFLDAERDLTLHQVLLARRTNYSQRRLNAPFCDPQALFADLEGWLVQVGFPSHALLVRALAEGAGAGEIAGKGIRDRSVLIRTIQAASKISPTGAVQLETDMRAHCNPTRMASIRQLTFQLVRRLRTPCPGCGSPGWGAVDRVAGLPCGWCGLPTALLRAEIQGCPRCDHRVELPRRDGLLRADPQHCAHCNP